MVELDLFRNFRRGVAAPSPDAQRRASARLARALDEATGGEQGTRVRPSGRRRLLVLAAAVLVVVVGAASAFGTVRDLFGDGKQHVQRLLCQRRQEGELWRPDLVQSTQCTHLIRASADLADRA